MNLRNVFDPVLTNVALKGTVHTKFNSIIIFIILKTMPGTKKYILRNVCFRSSFFVLL